jgi:hypothetical protein
MTQENIAEMICDAHEPGGEMADLSRKVARLNRALGVARKWEEAAVEDAEMFGRAQVACDQLEEELSRVVFEREALATARIIAEGHRGRGAQGSPDLSRSEGRAMALTERLMDAYQTLAAAPVEVFGTNGRPAEEPTRYAMMGALWTPPRPRPPPVVGRGSVDLPRARARFPGGPISGACGRRAGGDHPWGPRGRLPPRAGRAIA